MMIKELEQSNQGKNVPPKVKAPWRRFFARALDTELYTLLWNLVFVLIFQWNLGNLGTGKELCRIILVIVTFLAAEPVLLWKTGTTFGKWVLGLSVTADGERRLNYEEAFERTFGVLWKGQGLQIPIYSIYRQFRSYASCADGETLEWEEESILQLKDQRSWRTVTAAAIFVVILAIGVVFMTFGKVPKHRGEITVAQFVENYNQLADYYGLEEYEDLTVSGTWEDIEDTGVYEITGTDEDDGWAFVFFEENGFMTGLEMKNTVSCFENMVSWHGNEMSLAMMAYLWAQNGWSPFKDETVDKLKLISENVFKDFEFEVYGVSVKCDVEYDETNMIFQDSQMIYSAEENSEYTFEFVMKK